MRALALYETGLSDMSAFTIPPLYTLSKRELIRVSSHLGKRTLSIESERLEICRRVDALRKTGYQTARVTIVKCLARQR